MLNRYRAVYYESRSGGYVCYVEELFGVTAQGETAEEAEKNLRDAVAFFLQSNRTIKREAFDGLRVARRAILDVEI